MKLRKVYKISKSIKNKDSLDELSMIISSRFFNNNFFAQTLMCFFNKILFYILYYTFCMVLHTICARIKNVKVNPIKRRVFWEKKCSFLQSNFLCVSFVECHSIEWKGKFSSAMHINPIIWYETRCRITMERIIIRHLKWKERQKTLCVGNNVHFH